MVYRRESLPWKTSHVLSLSLFATVILDIVIVCLLWVDLNEDLISSHIPTICVTINCKVTAKHALTEKHKVSVFHFKNLDSIAKAPKGRLL